MAFAVLAAGLMLSLAGALLWRGSDARQERQRFHSSASSVTATLGTLLRRDADFVTTVRSVLTMERNLDATQFSAWYATLQGRERQVGGLGTAMVEVVAQARLASFLARRNADPAFRSLVGKILPVQRHPGGQYCLFTAGGAIISLDESTSRLVQGDWCWSGSEIGKSQIPLGRVATDTGQILAVPAVALGVPTMIVEAAFYRRGASLSSVAGRRAAAAGWIISTFDASALITAALDGNHNLAVTLYHRNPGSAWVQVGVAGSKAHVGGLLHTTDLAIDGDWRVDVRGAPTVTGLSATAQGELVLAAGTIVSVLLFMLLLVLARSRDRALGMVAEKTGELQHQALHDALTGLPNRVLALDRAEQMLARARRAKTPMAALYVDIDGFKHINDTFGHAAGDELLRTVAVRMRATIREADTAARLSGDEFLVLLDGSGLDTGPQFVAERLLEGIREPCDIGPEAGRALSITASIGVAYGLGQDAEELISAADVALYVAKASGKNHSVMFESGMQTATQDRLRLEMDLVEALEQQQLFLVYQPTVDLRSERTIGVEALLRWRHPTLGVIPADSFIPIAEESGLIVPIGRWVLQQACAQGAKWRRQGYQIGISVNVSAKQLNDRGLLTDVQHALDLSALDPVALTLEITETTLVRNAHETAERLAALRALGVRIAIDDFGSGYSSLAYLRQFPVDALKIDGSFMAAIADSKQSQAVVQTLLRLGKTLELETLAKGIGDREQLGALRRQHCDHGQGFLFAHPLGADDLEKFLDTHRRDPLTGLTVGGGLT